MLTQSGNEHQQLAQLVMRAVLQITMQAVNDESITAAWVQQWPELVLSVLKAAVLMGRKRDAQIGSQCLGVRGVLVQRIEQHHSNSFRNHQGHTAHLPTGSPKTHQ